MSQNRGYWRRVSKQQGQIGSLFLNSSYIVPVHILFDFAVCIRIIVILQSKIYFHK